MSINKYFNDELTALRVLGLEFAESNPRLAPFLATEARDPDVERLLEGFAFLTGRLRQKLDDELPELTHSVMNLLWPNFLKPIPSISMLQMIPKEGLTGKKRIRRKSTVLSKPVDGTQCQFQTCYDVDLFPFSVSEVEHSIQATGSNITIKLLMMDERVIFDELILEKLRFHLFGDIHTSYSLYLFFSRYLQAIHVKAVDVQGNKVDLCTLNKSKIEPVGFSDNELLLPYTEHLFKGYRILQEYFALQEKYLFVDVNGLENLGQKITENNITDISAIELQCVFDRTLSSGLKINQDTMKLYCTPIINLFEHKSAPIKLDHKLINYRLIPSSKNPKHFEIYHVKSVEGWGHSDHKRKEYSYFESFRHSLYDNPECLYYKITVKESQDGHALDSYIAFVNHSENSKTPQEETIEASLICTNRNLPIKLGIGDINTPGSGMPEFVEFTNISPVTPEFIPPMSNGFHWQLISNMSLNYQTLMNKEALGIILSTYDYRSYYDRQQARASKHRWEGIDSINVEHIDRLYLGLPLRGIRTTIRVLESKFANEGEMFLFFTILNEFFSLYVSLNSFHELQVLGIEHGEIYQWTAKVGQQPII